MKKVVLLGTSHSIQRGKSSPEQFRKLIEGEFSKSKFQGIAEEIDKGSKYIAEEFCSQNQLEYLCMEPDQSERRNKGISSANEIVFEIMDEFDEKHPGIRMWPSDPSPATLPGEVWKIFSERTESSYRAREAVWLEKLVAFNVWPVLCICGANHFAPFAILMIAEGIQVTELHQDWEPTK